MVELEFGGAFLPVMYRWRRAYRISGAGWAALALILTLAAPAAAQEHALRSPETVPEPGGAGAVPDASLTTEESEALTRALDFDARTLTAKGPSPRLSNPSLLHQGVEVSGSDRPDGSKAVAIKRALPTDWDAHVGVDLNTATPAANGDRDRPLPDDGHRGSGAAWASVGVNQYATVDARVDPSSEQGKLGATLHHSVPIGGYLSVTLSGNYAVTATAGSSLESTADPLAMAVPQSSVGASAPSRVWSGDEAVKVDVKSTGTTLSAGLSSTSNDPETHNVFSAEQKVYGPLHVTTSVKDIGEASASKSITAGFNLVW